MLGLVFLRNLKCIILLSIHNRSSGKSQEKTPKNTVLVCNGLSSSRMICFPSSAKPRAHPTPHTDIIQLQMPRDSWRADPCPTSQLQGQRKQSGLAGSGLVLPIQLVSVCGSVGRAFGGRGAAMWLSFPCRNGCPGQPSESADTTINRSYL